MKSRTEILVPLAAIQAVPIAVIAWYRLHRYAWYRYSAIVISWKEEKYVGEKFFLTYDRIIITTGICPKTFAPIYPHYKSFDSYIKPQRCILYYVRFFVVYFLIPTSNHNLPTMVPWRIQVVYLLIPTSNHNPHTYCFIQL